MDVATWLKNLGLGQYEAAFRDNAIDGDLLPSLTTEDLKDLGVTIVGHRRKLLDAIVALGVAPKPAAPPAAPSPPPRTFRPDAERRPITVMFCDLVGSTALASRLDAEDWRSLVNAYLDEASGAVNRLGGHVLKRLGDGLMALFGYPQAQENDAERAVRAALAIQRALGEMNARNAAKGALELSARIGLESGPVVVETTGEVFGEAPNIAARVQGLAEPGAVLVTANVQRQTAGLFVAEDKGARELKGVPAPVTLYRIVRASGGRRAGARTLTHLVGREEELDLLRRRWERARAGSGQLTLIVGEPGIGKSRLVQEFRATLAETPHTFVELSSSQLLQNTPLHPIAEWGRQRFGADEPADRRLADLENTLRLIGLDPNEYAPLIAPLVDVPLPEERAAKLAPEELRRRQLAALTTWFLAGARSQPVALAFEDLHWADPTSLDLMQALAERGAQAPMLILATARPEFRPPWSLRSHHSVISLSPLDRADVALMVGELAARRALSKEVVEGLSERTGGVPLFVEEVTRLLLERGEAGGLQAIPPTLQQSLAARLDRLGDAREVAQIGAVLGRDFTYALLSAVGGVDDPVLQSALDRLAGADLLIAVGAGPQASYRFKHALIQDAAYDSLLKSRRQALHRRAAEILVGQPERAAAEPEAIAHHFTEAGLDDLAIEWWGKAGDQALRRSAFQEAIAHLGKAIAMADKASATTRQTSTGSAPPNQRLTQLHVARANALFAARGFGAPETTGAFKRAHESAHGDADAPERLAADYGLWAGSYVRGELSPMRVHVEAFLSDIEATPDSPEAGIAYRVCGVTHQFAGEYAEARENLERALTLFQPGRDDDMAFHFGLDVGATVLICSAIALWPLGEVERALSLAEGAQARLAAITHAGTLAFVRQHLALFELMRRDRKPGADNAFELARLARDHDLTMFRAFAAFFEGWAIAENSTPGGGLEDMRRGVALLREQNILFFDGLLKIALAEEEARAGDCDRAVAILDEALATSNRTGYRAFEAELHRARGEILLKRDPANPAPAEDAYLTAIAVANRQATRSFELRAALGLAKLYRATGRPADAHAVLAPALAGFAALSLLPSGRRAGDEGASASGETADALAPDPSPRWERGTAAAEMPEITEAWALLTALAESDEVKAEAPQRRRLTQLQVAYGNALTAARGFGAPETTAAFARARESASGVKDAPGRLVADWGLWSSSYVRGELPSMRAHVAALLSGVEARPDSPEAGVAHRAAGLRCWFAGEYREARDHFERALALFQPGRDDDLAFRFGHDSGVAAMAYLAMASWPLGEVDRAISLIDRMQTRIADLTHVGTLAFGRLHEAFFELMRRDHARAPPNAFELARLGREHDLPMWAAFGVFLEGLATAATGAPSGGLDDMRRGVELLREQNVVWFDGLLKTALADAEARAGDPDRAVAILDEALATADRTGYRAFEAELHRTRGEILLKRDPANPAPAEEAFLTALAVAKQQGTRSFELRAALALAKLSQSTGRPADAHAVLAPALEGFSPTPEMPEIAEAQALLAVLAETEGVKAAEARRRQRLHLQTAYGQAMMWAEGFAAEETQAAFSRATELAAKTDDFTERFAAAHFEWTRAFLRGELRSARALGSNFLKEAEETGRIVEAGVARRGLALACYQAGDFVEAQIHCERALEACAPDHERETQERFHDATGPIVLSVLAMTMWQLGEVGRARELIDQASQRGRELGHAPSMAHPLLWRSRLEILRGDPAAALTAAEALVDLGRDLEAPFWRVQAELDAGWARGRLHDAAAGAAELGRALTRFANSGGRDRAYFHTVLLAGLEAEALGADRALARIDEGLALARQIENRCNLAFSHLLRGKLLLKRDPSNPDPAEEAFQTALDIAKQQGARSWGLRAALALAKLYQSTGRPADARAVLAPALEGFSPTPEMPEIAEAQALLAALAETGEVRAEAAQRRRMTHLRVAYGHALIATRGYGAPETTEAFTAARESTHGDNAAPERLAADYGLWVGSYVRGELAATRAHAAAFRRDVEARPDSPTAGVAHRVLGATHWSAGEYVEARDHLERALALFEPTRDDDLAFHFGQDAGVAVMFYLAFTLWPLGDVERAASLVDAARARIAGLPHVQTRAYGKSQGAMFELMRGDLSRVARNAAELAAELARLALEHDLPLWRAFGVFLQGLARAESDAPGSGLEDMRRGVDLLREQNVLLFDGMLKIALAEAEARAGDVDRAAAVIDEALATCERTGYRAFEAELYRVRGETLLKRDQANSAPAEEALQTAIAVGQRQGTRSFELRAALALAKLYQSTGRPTDAHAVLAPALEGFSPTPEMPEIAEAQALLARLA